MSDEMKVQTKGLNKKFLFAAIALIVVGLVAALVLLLPTSAKAKKVEEQLNLGTKYLSELDYEQAIVAYEAVIKIDPKCEEAYLALADVYIAMGDFDKAEGILKQAEEALGSDVTSAISNKKKEVTEVREEQKLAESTPISFPTEVPEPTEELALTNMPTTGPTPTSTVAPTSTPIPTPTNAPLLEGSVRSELKLANDGFTYGMKNDVLVCTGLSEKGYKEIQKYGPESLVSIILPAVSDDGSAVGGFLSKSSGGYGLKEILNQDSAYVELVCPDSYTVYYGVCDEQPSSKYAYKLKSVVLNEGILDIAGKAFYNCVGLSSINIPRSVTTIGQSAFGYCSSLVVNEFEVSGRTLGTAVFHSVTINTVKVSGEATVKINRNAFESGPFGEALVKKVVLSEGLEVISEDLFRGCTSLQEVQIPSTVTTVGGYAFYGCGGLTKLVIPSSVTTIGNQAFYGCTGLTGVTIPESVTTIGNKAFEGCSSLVIDEFEVSGRTLGTAVFHSVTINAVKVSGEVTVKINRNAFESGPFGGALVKKVVLSEGLEVISEDLFRGCTSLQEVQIPSTVTTIGGYAFYGCSGLTKLVIPSSVTTIGNQAFYGCTGLTGVTIPESVTTIGNEAFKNCSSLVIDEFEVSGRTLRKEVFNNVTINTLRVSGEAKVSINRNAGDYGPFRGALVKNVVLAEGLKVISEDLFRGCTSLQEVQIPSTVTTIGGYAFYGCSGLTKLVIPSSATTIGSQTFRYCKELTSVEIPESVTKIANDAFRDCTAVVLRVKAGSYAEQWATSNGFSIEMQ